MADVESSNSSSAGSSDSCSDSGGEMSDDSSGGHRRHHSGAPVNLTLAEATQQLYANKGADDPTMKPSFLRANRGSGVRDSGTIRMIKLISP